MRYSKTKRFKVFCLRLHSLEPGCWRLTEQSRVSALVLPVRRARPSARTNVAAGAGSA